MKIIKFQKVYKEYYKTFTAKSLVITNFYRRVK